MASPHSGSGGLRWWKGRRKPDDDVVDHDSDLDVIDLRPSALEEWERSAGLVEYPSDLKHWCADLRNEGGEPDHPSADAVAHALADAKGIDLVIEDDRGMIERWEGPEAPPPH